MSRTIFPPAAVEYPSGDGKPMAENDAQLAAILYAIGALRVRYRNRGDVYVSGDLLMYYEEGNPKVSVAPDVFVVFGVEDRVRMHYKVWEEGKGPDFVLEVASKSTWARGPGTEARALRAARGEGVLALRPDRGVLHAGAPGTAPGRWRLRAPSCR